MGFWLCLSAIPLAAKPAGVVSAAEVVELVDALRSGRSEGNLVGVRVPPSAP